DDATQMIEKLPGRYLSLPNILGGLSRLIAPHDQVALEMHTINANVRAFDFEPGKGKATRRIDSLHRFPTFSPRRLRRLLCQNGNLLFTQSRLKRFLERRTDGHLI